MVNVNEHVNEKMVKLWYGMTKEEYIQFKKWSKRVAVNLLNDIDMTGLVFQKLTQLENWPENYDDFYSVMLREFLNMRHYEYPHGYED